MMTHIGKYLMKDGQIWDVASHKDRVLGVIYLTMLVRFAHKHKVCVSGSWVLLNASILLKFKK